MVYNQKKNLYAHVSLDRKTEVELKGIFIAVGFKDEWKITLNLKPTEHPKLKCFLLEMQKLQLLLATSETKLE